MIRPDRLWVPEAPYLITRPTIEVGEVPFGFGVEGYFTVELIHAATGDVVRKLEFKNLITDAGLRLLAAGTQVTTALTYLAVGAGTTEPEVTDTALEAEFARTNATGGFSAPNYWGPGYSYAAGRRVRFFTEAQANGEISELGFLNQASGGTLFNRQLLRDGDGLPTTITKRPDQQLKVTFENRVYGELEGAVAEVPVLGVPTTVRTRLYCVSGYRTDPTIFQMITGLGTIKTAYTGLQQCFIHESNNLPATIHAEQTAPNGVESSIGVYNYAAGTTYRDFWTGHTPAAVNFATGIGSIATLAAGNYVYASPSVIATFTPKIPKNSDRKLTMNYRIHYGRHTP